MSSAHGASSSEGSRLPQPPPAHPPAAAPTGPASPHLVFLSHAGEQKREFVDLIRSHLKSQGVEAFLDEHALQQGQRNATAMEAALRKAPVGACMGSARGGRAGRAHGGLGAVHAYACVHCLSGWAVCADRARGGPAGCKQARAAAVRVPDALPFSAPCWG